MVWPDAEVEIDEACVRRLISAQFPQFSDLPTCLVGEGFDNFLWRLGEGHAVRLPRRRSGAALIERELRWLPLVANEVTLETPLPLFVGEPSEDFAWPWMIVTWIDGVAGDVLDDDTLFTSARPLAAFLRALHVPAPADAPHNPWRSVPLAARTADVSRRIGDLRGEVDLTKAWALFERAREAPGWQQPATWLHGDLHPGNMIYRDGQLVGVIDFGDLCAGDPATDLAGSLMALPFDALDTFFGAYGLDGEATLTRTLGWAVVFGTMMMILGRSGHRTYARIGRRALTNATRLAGMRS